MNDAQHKAAIKEALNHFTDDNLAENTRNLLNTLGYRSERTITLEPNTTGAFIAAYDLHGRLNRDKALAAEWVFIDPLFQLRGEDLTRTDAGGWLFDPSQTQVDNTIIESYFFLLLRLSESDYNRTQLSQITCEINKLPNASDAALSAWQDAHAVYYQSPFARTRPIPRCPRKSNPHQGY